MASRRARSAPAPAVSCSAPKIGQRVSVYWPGDDAWYDGTITSYASTRHGERVRIAYQRVKGHRDHLALQRRANTEPDPERSLWGKFWGRE